MGFLDRLRGKKKEEATQVTKPEEYNLKTKLEDKTSLYTACFEAIKDAIKDPNSSPYVDTNIEDDALLYDAEALQDDIWEFLPLNPGKLEKVGLPTGGGTEKIEITLDNADELIKQYKDNSRLIKQVYRGVIGLFLAKGSNVIDEEPRKKMLDDIMRYGEEYLEITEHERPGLLVAYFPSIALNAVKKYIASQPTEKQAPQK